MKPYNHLLGYLHRWCIMKIGRFMMRLHRLLDCDRTPFLHTHPFWYISIVLRGGYTEQILKSDGSLYSVFHGPGSIIFRSPDVAHRISSVESNCTTLFLTWYRHSNVEQTWKLLRHPAIKTPAEYHNPPDGIYMFDEGFRRRHKGMWYALRKTPADAELCSALSIHQNIAT